MKDLASRDVVSRSIYTEIREGRGCGPEGDHVYLDLTHLPPEQLDAKLPDITEFARTYLGVEPYTEPVPVFPTAHYAMGGIPTNITTEVLQDNDTVVPGLYAAGEVACVSVHGSNRLGTNSLLDINVFGKRAGIAAAEYAKTADFVELPEDPEAYTIELLNIARNGTGDEKVAQIRKELQDTMDANMQVFRTAETLNQVLKDIASFEERYKRINVQDKGKRFNLDLLEAVELGFLLELAKVMTVAALHREESRGGHFREDFPERDDEKFMKHSMAYKDEHAPADGSAESIAGIRLGTKPVVFTRYEPMVRKY
jgi:succinate dehydrogenase / fumarate reductase flavoprotein subunit